MPDILQNIYDVMSRGKALAATLLIGGIGFLAPQGADAGEFANYYYGQGGCACEAPSCDNGCDNGCGGCEESNDPWKLFSEPVGGVDIGGWTQWGYTSESTGMFNDIPDRFNNHQSWIYAEKVADGSNGWDWGARADLMYGTDSYDTQAFGNNPGRWDYENGWDHGIYGWAMPQAYGEIANGDLSVKFGHFFTLVGYEVVPATGNFFFSHAYTMYNSEPFTHTGALATYKASDDVTLYGGWTLGWDTGFDQFDGGSSFLGGAALGLTDDATLTYILTAGNMGQRGDGYSHSIVLDVNITEKWNYVLQSDLVSFDTGAGQNDEYGINQYLFYTINDQVKLGSRVEWWSSDAGFDHGGQSPVAGGQHSYYEATFGVNYKPIANLIVRPEYRHDWFPHGEYTQDIFGIDAILTF